MLKYTRSYFRLLAEGQVKDRTYILSPLLQAASWIYGITIGATRSLYNKKALPRKRLPFPVISVGNVTWGGTGKTPLVEYLARKVSHRNKTPLILTRGYGQDEVEQFKQHLPRAVIGAGKDRLRVAEEMKKKHRIDLAILDDGLQHWPIERDMEIIVINALNPFGNEKLIPHGILREPVSVLNQAGIILISHVNLISAEALEKLKARIRTLAPKAFLVESQLEPLFFYRADKRSRISLDRLQNHRVTTFSGVGTPRSFQLLLASCQIKPTRNFEFEDHHQFTVKELEEIKRVSTSAATDEIITTEKDFYRDPERIAKVLNPLILATRLRILAGEEVLSERLFKLMGVNGA